ncbi:serine/threonine protein kinase [Coemansia sp. RSA 1935]|nr:serine/threonine protein kinase [Coemansia sp. RSA 1938]KAJ2258021.1 serine/threonine protein kinase [Coemansia sp. RSA 454]KAJ2277774.1 serine/threonine protein kinase [Coemansia sp. RSA 371]KAJ2533707.1 serine/threonine protein kinase [Coemansia sp. RSA 1935]KAJ2728078.1 serine/threonine protein kinase [Coemansia sp. D1744]
MLWPSARAQDTGLDMLLPSPKPAQVAQQLSPKATLVSPHSAAEQYTHARIGCSSSRHAVDGTLSLSVRPTGWTHAVFGQAIRRLGAGTGGSVDLHYCPTTNKTLAIKTIQIADEPTGSAQLSRRVLEELGIAANVRHANIVRTFDVVVEPDRKCYMVMEACTVDLLSVLQQQVVTHGKHVTDSELNTYFVQVVRGVHYLHAQGIGHRDLKLDNICVTEHGTVKIVDFGCATLFRRRVPADLHAELQGHSEVRYVETMSTGVCGSDPYIAPEVLAREWYSAACADVWALGIVFFAMQNLQFPWAVAHEARDSGFKAFVRSPQTFIEKWFASDGARGVMSRVLSVDPSQRASVSDVIHSSWFLSLVND